MILLPTIIPPSHTIDYLYNKDGPPCRGVTESSSKGHNNHWCQQQDDMVRLKGCIFIYRSSHFYCRNCAIYKAKTYIMCAHMHIVSSILQWRIQKLSKGGPYHLSAPSQELCSCGQNLYALKRQSEWRKKGDPDPLGPPGSATILLAFKFDSVDDLSLTNKEIFLC